MAYEITASNRVKVDIVIHVYRIVSGRTLIGISYNHTGMVFTFIKNNTAAKLLTRY